MSQNYLMVNEQTNIVDNQVVWDGNPDTWQPPEGYLMLVQATTPAKIWQINADHTAWELVVVNGAGCIGFTWDGMFLMTDQPEPPPIPPKE